MRPRPVLSRGNRRGAQPREPSAIGRSGDLRDEPRLDRSGELHRAEARADDAHPADLAVTLGEVGLLLDDEAAVGVRDREAVADAFAVGDRVDLDGVEGLDLVGVLEPELEEFLGSMP